MKKMLSALLIAVILFGLVSCGGGGPKGTVDEFFNALKKNDADKLATLVKGFDVDGYKKEIGKPSGKALMELVWKMVDYKIIDEKIDGDKATVTLEVKKPTNEEMNNTFKELGPLMISQSVDDQAIVDKINEITKDLDFSKMEKDTKEAELLLEKVDGKWMILDKSVGSILNQ